MKIKPLLLLAPFALTLFSCKQQGKNASTSYKSAWDPATLDSTFKPGDDFFDFVDAKWIKDHPIPADKGSYGAFTMLRDQSQMTIKKVMEDAAKASAADGTNTQKVGDFYTSGMDTVS